jgi:hypothetical protein
MANSEHVYDIPEAEELAQLVGAATPHFAPQARARIAKLAAALPPDHPRQAELRRVMDRLEELAFHGESGGRLVLDLPPRAPLEAPVGIVAPAVAKH